MGNDVGEPRLLGVVPALGRRPECYERKQAEQLMQNKPVKMFSFMVSASVLALTSLKDGL